MARNRRLARPGANQGGDPQDEGNCGRADPRRRLAGGSRRRPEVASGFVLDASVAAAWCFADETTPESDALRGSLAERRALVPRLWRAETTNLLLMRSVARASDRIGAKNCWNCLRRCRSTRRTSPIGSAARCCCWRALMICPRGECGQLRRLSRPGDGPGTGAGNARCGTAEVGSGRRRVADRDLNRESYRRTAASAAWPLARRRSPYRQACGSAVSALKTTG